MANAIQYKWNVFCNVEGGFVSIIQKPKPTVCPNDSNHSIDLNKTFFEIEESPYKISENYDSLGYYLSQGINFTATANSTTTYNYTFPFDITIINARLFCEDENKNDVLNIILTPNLLIGVLTQAATAGNTTINVSSTVIDFCVKGTLIMIGSDTYYVKSVNVNTSVLTLTSALVNDYSPGTVVDRTVHLVKDFKLPSKEIVYFGNNDLKRVVLPAGYVFRFIYQNITGSDKLVNLLLDCY